MIHVWWAWFLPSIACLPQFMDKFISYIYSNLQNGLKNRF